MARNKPPARMGSVWAQMPFMHGEDGAVRLIELTSLLAEASERVAGRRALIARHPHVAEQAKAVCRTKQPWNGYVPPRNNPDGEHPQINDSPARVELERLLREAARADAEAHGCEVTA